MGNYYPYLTPIGQLWITETDAGISAIGYQEPCGASLAYCETDVLRQAAVQLSEYFAGTRKSFTLRLCLKGTPFQQAVWNALLEIPYGETRSYQQIAKAIGRPNAYRAVGGANHKNPVMIVVPCHRVIGADGQLTGYASGLAVKERLLQLERSYVNQ